MSLAIELTGIELFGYHGVLEEERRHGQRFLLDVELFLADERAAATDAIEDAVDYRAVLGHVQDVFEARAYRLLEALAADVAEALLAAHPVARARVRVRKPDVTLRPPAAAAVVVERRRGG